MIDIRTLQNELLHRGEKLPKFGADGSLGRETSVAIDHVLATDKGTKPTWHDWPDQRRRTAFEQIIMRDANIEVGDIDGLVGPQITYARDVWDARQKNGGKPVPAVENWRDKPDRAPVTETPAHAKWPHQRDVPTFFGAVGASQISLELPFPMRIAWDPEKTVSRIQCHAKCRDAFFRIWKGALDHYGFDHLKALRLDMYGGVLNVRKMRGGSAYSMHSWGIAQDIDPERNQLKFKREQATLDDAPYEDFWKIVYAEGALSLGRERNYDWMHFQFTSDFS